MSCSTSFCYVLGDFCETVHTTRIWKVCFFCKYWLRGVANCVSFYKYLPNLNTYWITFLYINEAYISCYIATHILYGEKRLRRYMMLDLILMWNRIQLAAIKIKFSLPILGADAKQKILSEFVENNLGDDTSWKVGAYTLSNPAVHFICYVQNLRRTIRNYNIESRVSLTQ